MLFDLYIAHVLNGNTVRVKAEAIFLFYFFQTFNVFEVNQLELLKGRQGKNSNDKCAEFERKLVIKICYLVERNLICVYALTNVCE